MTSRYRLTDPEERDRKLISRAVRWVLRYAVVPRELTRDYLDKVLAPYVAAESSGEAPRDDTKLPGRYVDQDRWTKDPAIPQVLDKVWQALENYASGYGWISGKGDVLHLQPEVVQPMRELLQRNEQSYPLYNELHEVSSKYFEGKAKVATEPEKFGYWLAQALYHHFQRDGLNAAAAWTEYKRVCRAAGPEATLALAQSLSKDYLDDDLKPLPHFLTGAIVEMSLIDEAKRTGAFARLAIWLRPLSAGPQPAFGTLNNPGPLLDAARALGNRDQAGVNALLTEDWFKHCSDGNEYVAGRLVQANSIAWSEFSRRDELLKDALARARKGDAPWFPEYLLLGHAAANLTRYRYPEAIQLYDQACGLALARGASAEVVGDLLLRLGDIASPNGEWSLVVTHALRVRDRELGFPAYDEAIGWRMQRALLFSDIKEARDLARGGHPGAAWERIGDLAAAEFKFQEAEAAYSTATGEYERDRYRSSAVQVQLKLTKMLLEGMGNVQRADATLKRIGHPGEQVHWAERNRLRMRIEAFRASEYGSTSMLTESLGALEGFRLPPVYQASLCATYLSDWDGEGDSAASELLKCLGMLETDQARWAALLPLQERRNPPADRGLAGQFSKIVSAPSGDGPDAFVHWLGYLAGCRFFHHHTELRTAAERVVAYAGHNPYRLIPVLRLAPFDVEVPVPSTFNDSPVWGYVYLEAAERAWGRGDSGEFRNCADVLSAMSPFSGLHRAVWSFDLVQAMAAHGEGKHSEAKKLLESAKSVASELGDLREVGVIEEVEENLYPLISIREVRVEREMEVLIEIRDGAVVVDGKRVETEFAQRLAKPDDLYANFLTGYTTRIDGLQLELRKMVEHVEINRPRQLRISPASLATLPWELAFSPQDRVSRSVANSFVIQIPEPRPEPPRVAVLQEEADAERYGKRGYGLLSLRAEQYYAEAGLKAETFSLQNQDWQFRMQALEPNIIHICSGFYQSTQPRDAVLDLEAGEKSEPVGASSLASILERFGHLTRRPVVILDLSWDLSDGLRQVLLRNYFAACLWEASPMRAVIAAGGYEGRKAIPELQLLASAVARRARLVDIYWDLRNRTKPELPPALYTDHADAPIC